MSIKIEFLLKGQNDFLSKEISYEEYFDLEENEEVKIDSVPRFSQPYLYLSIDISEILLVLVCLEFDSEKRIFKQTVWNNGNNILTERIDVGIECYKEIVLSFKIDEEAGLYETIRFFVGNNFTVPTYHSLFYSDKSGKDIEKRFDTDSYVQMVKTGIITGA